MLKLVSSLVLASSLALAGFAAVPAQAASHPAKTIHATIHNKSGSAVGEVTIRQEKKGVLFVVSVHGLTAGKHGLHIHSVGKCDAPDFKTSGGHLALAGQQHGFKNPKGPHLGDLPNLTVKPDGTGRIRYLNTRVSLAEGQPNSLRKPGGTSLVIHAGPDDMMSNPAGNAGGRVACAVLTQ